MPELPEVETVRRGLQPVMEGARVVSVHQNRPDLRFPFPEKLAERLTGRRIEALGRRAKYLTLHLDDGLTVISHLGMSGSYRIEPVEADGHATNEHTKNQHTKNRAHDHLILSLEPVNGAGVNVIYNDPRRFGFILFAEPGQLDQHPFLAHLGVEPTGNMLSGALLAELFANRKTSLKAALLDQRLIAGLGNIYVCEALWRAGLAPDRPAGSITGPNGTTTAETDRLATEIRNVIAEAIAAGGSSLRDYVQADGALGYFQHSFSVYGREGEPCRNPDCDGIIERMVQSGRSTFYCASCQH